MAKTAKAETSNTKPSDSGGVRILYVDDDYRRAVVGTPDRQYLWVLAREPKIPEREYDALVRHAAAKGYDTRQLLRNYCDAFPLDDERQ